LRKEKKKKKTNKSKYFDVAAAAELWNYAWTTTKIEL
jgi:hypothetical protein